MRKTATLFTFLVSCTGAVDSPTGLEFEPMEDVFGPLGSIQPRATEQQRDAFARGRAQALKRWSPEEGLGPTFNVTFCGGCHEKPTFGGSAGRYRDFLLVGIGDGESFLPLGSSGVLPHYTLEGRRRTETSANIFANRNPIPFFGVGLLEQVPIAAILEREDPIDADEDGISGRANFDNGQLGRFGRKAQSATIQPFLRGPLFNHLGLTSESLPPDRLVALRFPSDINTIEQAQAAAESTEDSDDVPDPEVSEDVLFELLAFATLLAAPEPEEPTAQTTRGGDMFAAIGCETCHRATLPTPLGGVPAYTDLLVHDMGSETDDGVVQGLASGSEFRTQPLWGIAATGPYLHDGRASTLEDAILMHGGEGTTARDSFAALETTDRNDLIAFLMSLGGAANASTGLLPPNAPLGDAGTYGGPTATLSEVDAERFERGRRLFDFEFASIDGLGPRFNGDSCRACHFEPVLGGAGPRGVDVIRMSVSDAEAGAIPPPGGTLVHRFADRQSRPEPDIEADIVERRQTPHVFGLGLIEQISDLELLSRHDPSDSNGDRISGRVRILRNGRIGRFGWKASVATLEGFARDAMSAELGITVPEVEGPEGLFGVISDQDDAPDPEIGAQALSDLVFFMRNLAAPPRSIANPVSAETGASLFEQVGCDHCHVPALQDVDGGWVPLYSDLLLHDVAPAGYQGIADEDVHPREFRTAPLWGLGTSGPYMHDGASSTIDDAVLRHAGEATVVRDRYEALTEVERFQLLTFLESL